jgi:uncharacterized protein
MADDPPPATDPAPVIGPVADGERYVLLDLLRGFALFGILLINIGFFAGTDERMGLGDPTLTTDRAVQFLIVWLVQAKFYSLFSFLFGAGFAVMTRNADREGPAFNARFLRRSFALLGFGLGHVVFLWEGDILVAYALIGLLLLAFRDVSDAWLKRWVVGLLGLPFLLAVAAFLLVALLRLIPGVDRAFVKMEVEILAELARESAQALEAARNSNYGEAMAARLIKYVMQFVMLVLVAPILLAMFLAGFYVGRRRLPADPAAHRPFLRRAARSCAPAGLLLSLFVAVAFLWFPFFTALPVMFFNITLAGPLLGMGYAAILALIFVRTGPAWWTKPIAAAGRMALTNYLSQSLVNTLIFAGYAGGWIGYVSPLGLIGFAAVIYGCQLVISPIWLSFFHFGPMEWLWRAITYKTWPPMLRKKSSP